jgi:hypothetical protein
MENPKEIIQQLLLSNKQMAATLDIYTEYHLTKEEKIEAAGLIQASSNEDEINKSAERLKKVYDSAYQFSSEDSKWSPGFIRELLKYYEDQAGFNPIERLKSPFSIVKAYFDYKANEADLDEIDKSQLASVEEKLPEAMAEIKKVYEELEA